MRKEGNRRSLHYAPPDFLWNSVALANFMRLSLLKGAYAALSSAAWQEIRVRFGRDDKFVWKSTIFRGSFVPATNLSSRPERSVVEGPAVRSFVPLN